MRTDLTASGAAPKCCEPRWEAVAVLLIVGVILLINLLVAGRTPTVFSDEPPYTDAAANLYFGEGFVSTLWGQDRHAFWSGNVPLYQGALYAAFKIFGFGLKQARWMNAILLSAGGLMIWLASKRSLLLQHPVSRLICLTLVLSGAVSTLTFRTVRPDVMMFVVCAGVFFACTIELPKVRLAAVALAAILLPFAGISILPYVTATLLLCALIFGRSILPTAAAVALGLAGGVGLLLLFYSLFARVDDFFGAVLPLTLLGTNQLPLRQRLLARIVGSEQHVQDNLFTCFFGNPWELMHQTTLCDYGALALFVLLVVVVLARYRAFDKETRRIAVFGIGIVLLVPLVMHFLGHYRSYYRWMTYMPLCVFTPLLVERALAVRFSSLLRALAGLTFAAAMGMGVPLRTVHVLTTWQERSTKPIEDAAALVMRSNEVVICNFKVYFVIRPRAQLLFSTQLTGTGEFGKIVDLPKNEISLLCLSPGEEREVMAILGGKWEPVPLPEKLATELVSTRYDARFFRRVPSKS